MGKRGIGNIDRSAAAFADGINRAAILGGIAFEFTFFRFTAEDIQRFAGGKNRATARLGGVSFKAIAFQRKFTAALTDVNCTSTLLRTVV